MVRWRKWKYVGEVGAGHVPSSISRTPSHIRLGNPTPSISFKWLETSKPRWKPSQQFWSPEEINPPRVLKSGRNQLNESDKLFQNFFRFFVKKSLNRWRPRLKSKPAALKFWRIHLNESNKPYKCIHCGKVFGRKNHLRRQSITHTEKVETLNLYSLWEIVWSWFSWRFITRERWKTLQLCSLWERLQFGIE